MNKKISLLLAISGCLTISQLSLAGGNPPPKPKVLGYKMECGPGLTNCTQVVISEGQSPAGLNAAGDVVSYNTTGIAVENLGTINETKDLSMKVPAAGMKIYSFTPTKGHRLLANKPVKILFVTFDLNKPFPDGTPKKVVQEGTDAKNENPNRNTMVKVYSQKPGATQWTELVAYYTPEKDVSGLEALNVQVNPDGKAVAPASGETLEADFGKLD